MASVTMEEFGGYCDAFNCWLHMPLHRVLCAFYTKMQLNELHIDGQQTSEGEKKRHGSTLIRSLLLCECW